MKEFVHKILFRLNILWAAGGLLALSSPYVSPEIFWPASIAGLLFPVFFAGHLLFSLYWLFFYWKKSWLSILVLLLSISKIPLFYGFHKQSPDKQSTDIILASHNVFGLSRVKHLFNADSKKAIQKLGALVKQYRKTDILCLQEANPYSIQLLSRYLDFPYKHQYGTHGAMLMSKLRFIDKGSIPFSNQTNSCSWADIDLISDTIRVFCLHLQSNQVSKTAESINENNIGQSGTWKKILSMFKRYRDFAKYRAEEVKKVKKAAENSPFPVIITGDFNDQPLSYAYHILSENMQDAFVEKGQGPGSTYRGTLPFLRIDYILADSSFSIKSIKLVYSNISDHNMINAHLSPRLNE